jgi:hypothetical protein
VTTGQTWHRTSGDSRAAGHPCQRSWAK